MSLKDAILTATVPALIMAFLLGFTFPRNAMDVCERTHSFETCFNALR